jgi:hypothetical protein
VAEQSPANGQVTTPRPLGAAEQLPGNRFALATPCHTESTSTPVDPLTSGPSPVAPSARALGLRAELSDITNWNDPVAVKLEKLSQALLAALPPAEDVQKLCDTYKGSIVYVHQIMVKSHRELESQGLDTIASLMDMPGPRTHPVLIANWMLLMALFLQQTFPLDHISLIEDPKLVCSRLKDTATSLVTTNEELFGTVDSLECILMEAFFEKNRGNFRRAWLAVRRAMTAAQLMNLHRSHSMAKARLVSTTNARHLWFRIIYMDRFICLMLGLPAASLDMDLSVDMVNDTPLGQLERTHAMVSKSILERDEKTDPTINDYAVTERIDAELLAAAEKLPTQFWQPLNFKSYRTHDAHIFWETCRLANQVNHFNLLNHVHLPYLLAFKDERYSSSKVTCAHASREVLSRWMAFREHNALYVCCRIGDFFALRAGLTLCLAHVANHHNSRPLLSLRHQRLGDRSIVEQTIDIMERLATQVSDPLARESSDLLQRLLHVEADAAQGQIFSARKYGQDEGNHEDDGSVFSIYIPYFGVLKISPEGGISKQGRTNPALPATLAPKDQPMTNIGVLPITEDIAATKYDQRPGSLAPYSYGGLNTLVDASGQTQMAPSLYSSEMDVQNEQFVPDPIAGVNDWAFQGVDTAFFDSLMRGMTGGYVEYDNDGSPTGGFGGSTA